MSTYAVEYSRATGAVVGALRDDGASVPRDDGNADWRAFTAWADAQAPPVDYTTPAAPVYTEAWLVQAARAAAQSLLDAQKDHVADLLRAIVLVLLDELNTLRQRDRDRAADVAAATSLADLKTRWAARPSLADRTAAQARAAVAAKLSDGSADA